MSQDELADYLKEYCAYVVSAALTESKRIGIEDKIAKLAKAEILPEIAKKVPGPYSMDQDHVKVMGVKEALLLPHFTMSQNYKAPTLATGEVPLGFCIGLMMLYENKPMHFGSSSTFGMYSIIREISPLLDNLASKYKLVHINIGCNMPSRK